MIGSLIAHGLFLAALFRFDQRPSELSALWQGGGKSGQIFISLAPAQPSALTTKSVPPALIKSSQTSTPKVMASNPINKGNSGNDGLGIGTGFDATGAQKATLLAQIRQKIFARKDYPLIARENGDTGSVRLEFSINSDGSLKDVHLIKSSGVPLLDKAALASVKRAVPLPYFPEPIALTLEYTLDQ